jgi:hypothetical protein
MGTGFPFPVPPRKIPENMVQNLRLIYAVLFMPSAQADRQSLKENGIEDSLNFLGMYRPDTPWITQSVTGAAVLPDYIPDVTITGPIVLSAVSAEEQDAELTAWMRRGPTVLINLGSTTEYNEQRTVVMGNAIIAVLDTNPEVQVLWKHKPARGVEA